MLYNLQYILYVGPVVSELWPDSYPEKSIFEAVCWGRPMYV